MTLRTPPPLLPLSSFSLRLRLLVHLSVLLFTLAPRFGFLSFRFILSSKLFSFFLSFFFLRPALLLFLIFLDILLFLFFYVVLPLRFSFSLLPSCLLLPSLSSIPFFSPLRIPFFCSSHPLLLPQISHSHAPISSLHVSFTFLSVPLLS